MAPAEGGHSSGLAMSGKRAAVGEAWPDRDPISGSGCQAVDGRGRRTMKSIVVLARRAIYWIALGLLQLARAVVEVG